MHREQPTSTHNVPRATRRTTRAGFSLVELMTVVVIVGVLSAVAIPTFMGYVFKSRTGEATQFLGTIKLREEAFRSEFGMYCNTAQAAANSCVTQAADLTGLNTTTNFVPDAAGVGTTARAIPTTHTPWNELGARPTGMVRFSYAVAAGMPATAPAARGWTAATADFWFVAQAVGDLDGDGTQVTFETYSAGNQVWVGNSGGAIEKGWE